MLFVLPFILALCGYLAGPFFARADGTVQLASRIWEEDSQGLTERTLESEAFRDTGKPREELFSEARQVERRMSVGGAFLGVWCGVVIALKFWGLGRIRRQEEYEIDHAECVSCGRCFLHCPRERLRLKELAARGQPEVPSSRIASALSFWRL